MPSSTKSTTIGARKKKKDMQITMDQKSRETMCSQLDNMILWTRNTRKLMAKMNTYLVAIQEEHAMIVAQLRSMQGEDIPQAPPQFQGPVHIGASTADGP